MALRRARLRLDLRQARRCCERFRPAVTGWMAHARPFAFEPAPIVHAPSMYRFGNGTPTIPGYVVARPGSRNRLRRSASPRIRRTQRSAHREDRRDGARTGPARQLAARARATQNRLDRNRLRRLRERLPPLDRAARLRRLSSRLRNPRRTALLHDRRTRSTRSFGRSNHSAETAVNVSVDAIDDRRPYANWRRVPAPFDSGCHSDPRRSASRNAPTRSRSAVLGAVALAGATAANTIFIAIVFSASGFLSGTSIVAAQRIGAGDVDGFARTRSRRRGRAAAGRRRRRSALEPLRFAAGDPRAGRRVCRARTRARSISYCAARRFCRSSSRVRSSSGSVPPETGSSGYSCSSSSISIHIPLLLMLGLGWWTHHPFGIVGAGVSSLLSETIALHLRDLLRRAPAGSIASSPSGASRGRSRNAAR